MSSQDSNGCRASEMVESALDYFLDTYQKYGERLGDSPGSRRVLERMQDLGQFLRLEMGPEDDKVFEDEVREDSPLVNEQAEGPVRGRKRSSEEPDQEEQRSHRRRLDQAGGEDGERSAGERSGNDQVDEDGPQTTTASRAAKGNIRRLKVAQKIGGSYGSNQFPVRPVLEMLLADTPTKSTRAQREKEAFIRLVKGYMDWDVGGENENRKLRRMLKVFRPTHTLEGQCTTWTEEGRIRDQKKRIYTRHESLTAALTTSEGARYMESIINKACTIMFCEDFISRCKGCGGSAFRESFLVNWFQTSPSQKQVFQLLSLNEKKEKMDSLRGEYAAWHRSVEYIITNRNRLYELYHDFGPAVLLDPTWDIGQRWTKDFKKQYDMIKVCVQRRVQESIEHETEYLPFDHEDIIANAKGVVEHVTQILAGDNVCEFIKTFLQRFPSKGL